MDLTLKEERSVTSGTKVIMPCLYKYDMLVQPPVLFLKLNYIFKVLCSSLRTGTYN
jgi:hypothetical protein